MGKRSNFERRPQETYDTPFNAVGPLIPHLSFSRFDEPCAGAGDLVRHLESYGLEAMRRTDIEPRHPSVAKFNALDINRCISRQFITNPPWRRDLLHPLIDHLRKLAPTWMLLDADWKYTIQSADLMRYCSKVIAVGRLKWIPGTKMTGKDNCAWYLFESQECQTVFIPRVKNPADTIINGASDRDRTGVFSLEN